MSRYMAFIWDPDNSERTLAANALIGQLQRSSSKWQQRYALDGFRLFCMGGGRGDSECHILARNRGVVLGSLFEKHSQLEDDRICQSTVIDDRESLRIVQSRGKRLITECWGDYVAIICDTEGSGWRVIKDPSGDLPCLITQFEGIAILFSHMADGVDLRKLRFTCVFRARVTTDSA